MSPFIDFVRRQLSTSSVSDTSTTEAPKQERTQLDLVARSGYSNEGIVPIRVMNIHRY